MTLKNHISSKQKGFIAISLSIMIFMSLMGLTLLTFCFTHTKIVRARSFKIKETNCLYQDLVCYLHDFREKIVTEDMTNYAAPETDYFNNDVFPDTLVNSHNAHTVGHQFNSRDFPGGSYKRTQVVARLHAFSASQRHPYHMVSGVHIDVLSGDIPLPMFSFFVGKKTTVPAKTFYRENRVSGGDGKAVADDIDTKQDINGLLVDTLRLSGNMFSWREIREKLGLPPSDEPVPEGIHLLTENNILYSIVIQGDVEKIVFSIGEESAAAPVQKIQIVKETRSFEITYRPGEHYLQCWDTSVMAGTLFTEKITVNGNIWSVSQEGESAFLETSALVLTVSGQTVIRSNLQSRSLELKDIELSNLTLVCGKEDQFNGGGNSDVVVDTPGGEEIEVHATVVTDETFTNRSQRLKLSGSVSCSQLENNGSIEITGTPRKSNSAVSPFFHTMEYCIINAVSVCYIEEVSDEDI